MAWKVYDKTGNTVRCTLKGLEYNGTWMGACFVVCSLKSAVPVPFEIGDYVIYRGEKFEINYDPTALKKAAKKTSGEAFVYDNIKFNWAGDELTRCDFLDYVRSDNQIHFTSLPKFSFFASSIQDLADRIQVNLDRIYTGAQKWTVAVHPEYVSTTNVNIDINNIKVWGALELLNSKFGANFVIRGRTITIGTAGIAVDKIFGYGRGNGLYEIQRTADTEQQIITRLRAYGSTRNMPNRYYNKLSSSSLANYLPNNMAVENLMLPDFPKITLDPYIDSKNIEALGIRESSVYFDGTGDLEEIYPSMEGMTSGQLKSAGISVSLDVGDNGNLDEIAAAEQLTDDGTMDGLQNGQDVPPFTIKLKDVGFDINDYLTSETATISMKDGMCGGREFEIIKCKKEGNKYVLTCNRVLDDGLKLYFPYKDYNIKAGDKFVLLNIGMPDVYIQAASQRLLAAAKEYLAKNDYVRYSYEPKVDDIFMARQHDEAVARGEASIHDTLKEGDLMLFSDEDLGINGNIIIDTLIIKEGEDIIPKYTITLREEKKVGSIEKIQNQIDSIIGGGQGIGGLNTEQVRSIVRALGKRFFLSRQGDDTAEGLITFLKGLKSLAPITIGDFTTGMIGGSGGSIGIDSAGKSVAELDKAVFREGVIVPKITFNCIDVISGDKANTFAFGTIKEVDMANRIVILDLLDDQAGTSKSGDICRGVFHRLEGGNPVSDSYDLNGFLNYAGYATSYFTPTEILRNEPGAMSFRYTLQPGTHVHPCAGMTFYAYGSFTDASRRSMTYENRYYTRRLKDVDTWVIDPTKNIAMQDGLLEGLTIGGMQMHGVGTFMENAYMTGVNIHFTPSQIETLQGQSAYSASLSSYERVVKMDASGNLTTLYEELNVISGEGNVVSGDENVVTSVYNLSTRIQAFKGDKELLYSDSVQEDGYIVILSPKGCKASISAGVLTITEITDYEECYVDLKINCEGNAVFDKRFSVVIVRNGPHGENAVIYSLQPSAGIIKRDGSGNSDVSHIWCRVLKTDGGSTHVSDLPFGYSVEYRIDAGNWKGYKPETRIATEGIAGKIEFSLLHQGEFYTRIDYKQIYVVTDGQDGEEGKPGAPGAPGTDGKDGRYTELRYRYSFGRPPAPSGTSPAGWSLSPDPQEISFTHTGDFILSDGTYLSPVPAADSATYRQRVSFETSRPNSEVNILVSVSSEPDHDWGIVCPVDVAYLPDRPALWEKSGVISETLSLIIPSAGSHFIDIVYKKDSTGKQNADRMEYRIVQPRTCWLSTAVISPSGSPAPVWSAPVEFPTDTPAEERIYLLGKSHIIADFPSSDPYRDEYIGEAPAYDTSKPYVRGNVVRHGGAHKICLVGCTGVSPDDPDKWEDVGWWTDNPSGAGESFPYEYSCSRKFVSGKWGAYGNMALFSHFAKDGSDGETPVVTRLVPSVSQIGRTLTGSYEPESFSVWHKDTGGVPVKAYMSVWGSNDGSSWARVGSVENVSVKTVDVSRYPYKYFTIRTYTAPSVSFGSDYLLSASVTVLSDGEKGADGDTGAMPVYCGFFEQGTEYRYTDTARDIVNYRIDGEVFTFQVRTRGSVVTTPPSSSVGDDNWEPASRFKFVAMDTALIDGADIAGFLYKDGMMKSRKGLLRGQELSVSDVSPEDMYLFKPYLQFDGNKGLVNAVANVNTHFQVLDAGTDLKKNLSWMVLDAAGYNRISNLGESVGIPLYMHELGSPVFIGNMYNYSLSVFLTIQLPKSGDVFSTYPERAKITIAAGKMFRGVVIPNGDTYRRGGLNTMEEDGSSVHYPFGLCIYPISELNYLGMTKTQYDEDVPHYEVVH